VESPDANEAGRLGPDPPVAGERRRLLRLATVDVRPLRRHRDFRLLFVGQGLSFFGSMVTYVAIPYQAYDLTGSTVVVGLIAFAELPPILLAAFVGGALADAVDRRRLVQIAEAGLAVAVAVLLVNSLLPEPRLWVLFADAVFAAGLTGILRPPLDALLPRLVDRDELTAAGALDSFRMNLGMVAGPAVAGVLIATIGLPATYALDLATYAFSLVALSLMRAVPPPPEGARPSLRGIAEGIRYARSRPELVGTYGVDFIAMFFGMSFVLFPAYAAEIGGPEVLGVLYAAPAVGSLVATATSGWTNRVHRHGLAVIVAAGAWGVAMAGFGLAPNLALAVVALAVAGGADMISGIFRSVIWNQTIPDHLRGRLAGIEQVSYSSGPLLGDLEAGIAAAVVGLRTSIVAGGVLCVVGVAFAALALPAFRRYDARTWQPSSERPGAPAPAGDLRAAEGTARAPSPPDRGP
jgi:MFS family permease